MIYRPILITSQCKHSCFRMKDNSKSQGSENLLKQINSPADLKKLTPEQVTGRDGLIQQLTKRIVETAMQAEMTDHLGTNTIIALVHGETQMKVGFHGIHAFFL